MDRWIYVRCGEQSEWKDQHMWWLRENARATKYGGAEFRAEPSWVGPRPTQLPRNDDADRKRLSKSLPVAVEGSTFDHR